MTKVLQVLKFHRVACTCQVILKTRSRNFFSTESMDNTDERVNAARHNSSHILHEAKWLRLEEVAYSDENGKRRSWEMVARTTRPKDCEIDCVAIITILKRKGMGNHFVLVRQYRPPLRKYTIEFPAGLIDPNESPEECALRELAEETGYKGTVVSSNSSHNGSSNCISALDPGTSNCLMQTVQVEVDGNLSENTEPKKCVQDGERTEVLLISVSDLQKQLHTFALNGDVIDSRVQALADGIDISRRINERN